MRRGQLRSQSCGAPIGKTRHRTGTCRPSVAPTRSQRNWWPDHPNARRFPLLIYPIYPNTTSDNSPSAPYLWLALGCGLAQSVAQGPDAGFALVAEETDRIAGENYRALRRHIYFLTPDALDWLRHGSPSTDGSAEPIESSPYPHSSRRAEKPARAQ